MRDLFDYDRPVEPPYELVKVKPTGEHPLPRPYRGKVLIQTLHDGGALPARYRQHKDSSPRVDPELLNERYVMERDWGANLIAAKLAAALGVRGFGRCRTARVLIDFNRFPGSTPQINREFLDRHAINYPFTLTLDHEEKMEVLANCYDRTSDLLEAYAVGKIINITVHTYDERNPSLTTRPDFSLITVPRAYLREARMPYGVFDPLFPDQLAESTCSRILRDRISLNLERNGFRVTHNHPYPATDGSFEVRSQVWFFFLYLRKRFEAAFPDSRDEEPYQHVWKMLLNTNLRHMEGGALWAYLHRYRTVPRGQVKRFRAARQAYEHVKAFLEGSNVLETYRHSRNRPSSLGLEVRKDLVCELEPLTGRPLRRTRQQDEAATLIGNVVARAIATYFETDRQWRRENSDREREE